VIVGRRGLKGGWHGRLGLLGPRRAAFAGLVLGAALWNFASLCELAGGLLVGASAGRGEVPSEGCTSLQLDRPTGRTFAWPCPEAAPWLESALRGQLAAARGP
jgi:hypothetical protein